MLFLLFGAICLIANGLVAFWLFCEYGRGLAAVLAGFRILCYGNSAQKALRFAGIAVLPCLRRSNISFTVIAECYYG